MKSQFAAQMLNDQGKQKAHELAHELAQKFSDLLEFCEEIGMPGRELSLVATKLEEGCFYAKKAMATNLVNQMQKVEDE